MSLFAELKRRNVIRMAGLYLVGAWLIVQVAETLLPVFGTPEWVLKTLILLVAIGFVPALVFSWVFEFTPDGLKREREVVRSQSTTDHTARKLDIAVIVLLLGVGVMLLVNRFWMAAPAPAPSPAASINTAAEANPATGINPASIAVLPFADLSPAGDQAYFSDGMAEEILNVLVKVKTLHVASRTSSFAFKGQESLGIPAIARQLSVRHVLEGSVRRAGGTIRITAQLIDAEVDRHLWSDTFDRPLTAENVFAIQDEIAQAIVAALIESLQIKDLNVAARAAPTGNLTAYDLYLRARALFQARRTLDVAEQLLAQALAQDSGFADAWELRAAVQSLYSEYVVNDTPVDERARLSIEYAERALALNPASALALAVKAQVRSSMARELRGTVKLADVIDELNNALLLDPKNGNALNWLGLALGHVGDVHGALETFQRCRVVDPALTPCALNEYESLWVLDRQDEAYAQFLASVDKGLTARNYVNFSLLAHFEQKTAFVLSSSQSEWLPGWRRHEELYRAYRDLDGDHRELLRELLAFTTARGSANSRYLGNLLVPLGGHEFRPLPQLIWGKENVRYRQSAPFKSYIRASGVYAYWLERGFPPQCRAIGDNDFECP